MIMKELTPEEVIARSACAPGVDWLNKQDNFDVGHLFDEAIGHRTAERLWVFKRLMSEEQLKKYIGYLKELLSYFIAFAPESENVEDLLEIQEYANNSELHMTQRDIAKKCAKLSEMIREASENHELDLTPFLREKIIGIFDEISAVL